MSESINGGGFAFPQNLTFAPDGGPHVAGEYFANCEGMSLRDWFSGQALAGIIAHPKGPASNWPQCARDAYAIADAMIAQREKEESA